MSAGRPVGSQNKPGHHAGGAREGAGRPSAENGGQSHKPKFNLRNEMLHGDALPGAASGGSNFAPIFDMQLQREKERKEEQQQQRSGQLPPTLDSHSEFEPSKTGNKFRGVIELGQLAFEKNAVPTSNASLASITAATLQQNLSKEVRVSEWSSATLSDEQIAYAALDAHVALMIWDILKASLLLVRK
ncbi:hypothetical protein GYMLUDRAFT_1021748 [Collybiopsis luxurians FD-317 M1]|uniref:3'-5' exonuclease domain-containing protein n=1 Tax=Collybiopsis luxurians FD-317 M1 TaxID=944289 RepID=A0A0D0CA66_9AGAR|nr:hypothetical protein GYMLUDRAFT_1021748 [Collybiopsis luxurians FD-317 M1]